MTSATSLEKNSSDSVLQTPPARPTCLDVVLSTISKRGERGATDDEIEVITGMSHATASARRNDLLHAGWIKPSGERRKTRAGRPATVWVMTRAETVPELLKVKKHRSDRPSRAIIRRAASEFRDLIEKSGITPASGAMASVIQWLEGLG